MTNYTKTLLYQVVNLLFNNYKMKEEFLEIFNLEWKYLWIEDKKFL
jgi:hypothetical protein